MCILCRHLCQLRPEDCPSRSLCRHLSCCRRRASSNSSAASPPIVSVPADACLCACLARMLCSSVRSHPPRSSALRMCGCWPPSAPWLRTGCHAAPHPRPRKQKPAPGDEQALPGVPHPLLVTSSHPQPLHRCIQFSRASQQVTLQHGFQSQPLFSCAAHELGLLQPLRSLRQRLLSRECLL